MKRIVRLLGGLVATFVLISSLSAAEPDLSEYHTVATAVAAKVLNGGLSAVHHPVFLGLHVADNKGRLAVEDIASDSPAARAGVQHGDVLLKIDGKDMKSGDVFREFLRSKAPGEAVKLSLARKDKPMDLTATLEALSRPLPPGRQRASLGVQVAAAKDGKGVVIEQIVRGSVAEQAKLKLGEVVLKVDGKDITTSTRLRDALAEKKPDDTVTLTLLLAEKAVDFKVKLGSEPVASGRPAGFDTRNSGYWSKPAYRLAIICVEYPDVKHNAKITARAWEDSMFSKGTYKTSVTGQTAYGSMFDYYHEQSYGTLKIEGKAFEYVQVSKKRSEYASGDRSALLNEAMDKLLARDGKDALKNFDGVFYIYAGESYRPAVRGSLYWPHRSSVSHNGKRWPYFICPEGGRKMTNISVFCHEFGHMLGLPDLYARPENPGMEGVGVWCAMANQVGNGRPQQFCAWSKEKLGWVKPTLLDPTVKQKLILAPVEDSPCECFKVPLRPDGSEYLLLENRHKKGFDVSLPGEGLLIWRVFANRPLPVLEESHGIEGPRGPYVFLSSVPFPSASNDSFTPFTTPSSRSQLGGGSPVYITNIRRLPDGRITFQIGYEYQ